MKRKVFISIGLSVLALVVVVAIVYAFNFGNVDGVWGSIDIDGASCDRWATGPDGVDSVSPVLDNEERSQDTFWDQTTWWSMTGDPRNTDWNQVRYGGNTYWDRDRWVINCGLNFNSQSGMAFDGVNEVNPHPEYGYEDPFVLGRFCHINNPINSTNSFESVPLTVTVSEIGCGADAFSGPYSDDGLDTPITSMAFTYIFRLDETTNDLNPCPYLHGDPVNDGGCADAISISQAPADEKFRCYYDEDDDEVKDIYVDYTFAVLGFVPMNSNGTCPAWGSVPSIGQFISPEGTDNCACLYASITDYTPTAVDLVSFTAELSEDGILLAWQTANEIDNIGFNLYRAESDTGSKVKLNETLIPTNVMPGSLVGAFYSFEDKTVEAGVSYYYWLEDVEASGKTTLHGPVEVQ